jgi:phosphatidylglycerophosphate synthase
MDIFYINWGCLVWFWKWFFSDVDFQEAQPWMRPVIEFCAILSPNQWTGSRLALTLIITAFFWSIGIDFVYIYINFILLMYAFAGATDFCDGKSARFYNMCTKFGAQFDAAVDKIYILCALSCPCRILWLSLDEYWFPRIAAVTALMIATELAKVFMRYSKRFTESCYTANILGKYKFICQTIAVAFMWRLAFYYPQWEVGPMLIYLFWIVAIVLNVLSVIKSLYPEQRRLMMEFGMLLFLVLAIPLGIDMQFTTSAMLISVVSIGVKIKEA